ncbi:MAG: aminoglycoside phosphotransferase family protein, partial [Pseudomonas sp.]
LPRAQGQDLYRDALSWTPFLSLQHAYAAGVALARLHQAAEGFTAGARRTPVLVANLRHCSNNAPISSIETALAQQPVLAQYLADKNWQ